MHNTINCIFFAATFWCWFEVSYMQRHVAVNSTNVERDYIADHVKTWLDFFREFM